MVDDKREKEPLIIKRLLINKYVVPIERIVNRLELFSGWEKITAIDERYRLLVFDYKFWSVYLGPDKETILGGTGMPDRGQSGRWLVAYRYPPKLV